MVVVLGGHDDTSHTQPRKRWEREALNILLSIITTNTQVHGEHSFYPVVDPDFFDANLMGFKGYF